ncbi:hypothetical protein BJ878DRAFT_121240 [Calycina marina]|uniref:Uncharacterized protein n=1 Tax=Calycina marina TaxID=1763456 RepID=A0A9P7Z1W0_9HELO|nr:hypothetical protein BJ878DRAFT_121240 [Calycina marina]
MDSYVRYWVKMLNGAKWQVSSAGDPRCQISIAFACSDARKPDKPRRHCIILVIESTSGITIKRALAIFGYDDAPQGHCEVMFKAVRVPASNIILGKGYVNLDLTGSPPIV